MSGTTKETILTMPLVADV